jgi:phage terminase large subunit-like protein
VWIPPGKPHPDQEAVIEFADAAGFTLQVWQNDVLGDSLLEKRPHKWASFENALVVPRQNGKTELAIARMLAGALVLGERLIIYTAHLARTSEEVFRRTREKIEEVDWIAREVKHTWRANGPRVGRVQEWRPNLVPDADAVLGPWFCEG